MNKTANNTVTVYGIKNCDTMKKAFGWLSDNGVDYTFHDYKKQGADQTVLKRAIKQHGWETVINRRGTTWRSLSDDVKNNMTESLAAAEAIKNPSLIKRPLIVCGDKGDDILLGFDPAVYADVLG